jgi:hypothetical protein
MSPAKHPAEHPSGSTNLSGLRQPQPLLRQIQLCPRTPPLPRALLCAGFRCPLSLLQLRKQRAVEAPRA